MKDFRSAAMAALFLCASVAAFGQTSNAVLPSQPIGPGDLVQIQVLNFPEFTRAVRVSSEGTVTLPYVRQPIPVLGKLPIEVEGLIRDTLRTEELAVNPSVSVAVAEYSSRPISVIGAVKNPIIFQAIGLVTLSDAIIRAGGFLPEAGPELLLTRTPPDGPRSPTQHILVRDLLQAEHNEANVVLTGHEEIRVPPAGKMYVFGDVKAPGVFPVLDQTDTTVMKALSLSGGLSSFHTKEAYVIRKDEISGTKHSIQINLHAILHQQAADFPLISDDILFVPDDRKRRDTLLILDRLLTFGASVASGILIYNAATR